MTHVVDDLELYALAALPPDRVREIERHLAVCGECHAAAADLEDIVSRLPEAIAPRDPAAALKTRILAVASADAPRRATLVRLPRIRLDARVAALAAAIVVLIGVAGERSWRAATAASESAEYAAIANDFAHGGRTWYMAGVEQWRGSGGNLMQPASGEPAFVVFHDLKPLTAGQLYALWLIAPDGKWVRGASFRPDGREVQMVAVGQELAGFDRCAVTVETSATAKREGPIVMQSRIAPPAPQ